MSIFYKKGGGSNRMSRSCLRRFVSVEKKGLVFSSSNRMRIGTELDFYVELRQEFDNVFFIRLCGYVVDCVMLDRVAREVVGNQKKIGFFRQEFPTTRIKPYRVTVFYDNLPKYYDELLDYILIGKGRCVDN